MWELDKTPLGRATTDADWRISHRPTLSIATRWATRSRASRAGSWTRPQTFHVISLASVISSIAYFGPSRPVPEFFTPP